MVCCLAAVAVMTLLASAAGGARRLLNLGRPDADDVGFAPQASHAVAVVR